MRIVTLFRKRCARCGTLLNIDEQRWHEGSWYCVPCWLVVTTRLQSPAARPPDRRP